MSVADYVTPGRCLHCGSRKMQWGPEQVVDAVRRWVELHGRIPGAEDWKRATPEFPAQTVAQSIFGGWNNMIRAAGFEPRPYGSPPIWTKDRVAEAMLDWLLRYGRWPTCAEWKARRDEDRPNTSTVRHLFGTWNAAKRYAGWVDGETQHTKYLARRDYKNAAKRAARARKAEAAASPTTETATASDERKVAA